MKGLIILSLLLLASCASNKSYKNQEDIISLSTIPGPGLNEYVLNNLNRRYFSLQDPAKLNIDCQKLLSLSHKQTLKIDAAYCLGKRLTEALNITSNNSNYSSPFIDIPTGSIYLPNIMAVAVLGIMPANTPNEFGVNDYLSGKELVQAIEIMNLLNK
ncbi:MAG: hypothetical protein KAG61_04985 [Bacteriovoracaceae bacterium]|nr:hypothetical protein [Bacteriovoracaceae bacterium]